MEYNFTEIEERCKKFWADNNIYKATEDPAKPKYYVLDMFPYPSGAGLHVGHPLGYVASDIYARYKRMKGFNVLHPMGYDAFGLPAEQYAIETGTHPAVTTEKAIKRYREQMDKIGFSFDWSREVRTNDPKFYKWTQWIFLKLFNSWFNKETNKAEPIETLIEKLKGKSEKLKAGGKEKSWNELSEASRQNILMNYRLAFQSYSEVNWCPALGTVLANDEVKDGKSERGGHPVERRKMRQWFLRITEYADRLLEGLDKLDWSEAMKEMQRNWIGRSEGALVRFNLSQTLSEGEGLNSQQPKYYTTDGQRWNTSIENAKQMRKNPTEAEAIVWSRINASQLGYKFRRQHPIDDYIVDFVCLKKGLIVEIDGKIHQQQKEYDAERTKQLERYGFTVLRFSNEEVIAATDKVIEKIKDTLKKLGDRTIEEDAAVKVPPSEGFREVEVFTTRPDTIFGATFMVIAAEHELVSDLTTAAQKQEVEKYLTYVKSRTDVERQQEKKVTGVFTGSYAVNPFTGKDIPIYIAEYVLAGYGTGAIMAVPADDERDLKFAQKFGLPVIDIIDKSMHPGATIEDKVGKMINSDFLNGLEVVDAIRKINDEIEKRGIGKRKVNYKLHDAGFSRQRYWGEPFPIKYNVVGQPDPPFEGEGETDDIAVPLSESELPLILPEVESYKPTGDGRSPLANNKDWVAQRYETDTMPGYAGSSWYYLRYMDPHNHNEFAAKEKMDYWQNVDLYIGGSEHAVGHLLYARFWHKFLFDLGYVNTDEPFKKLVNQGMIQGVSQLLYFSQFQNAAPVRKDGGIGGKEEEKIISIYGFIDKELKVLSPNFKFISTRYFDFQGEQYYSNGTISFLYWHIPVSLVDSRGRLTYDNFKKLTEQYHYDLPELDLDKNVFWIEEDGIKYVQLAPLVEKMSKRYGNVVNPDDVIAKHGADCFRMFEMFLGPIEQSKPWDDKGISGVSNFLRKFWRLFYDDNGNAKLNTDEPTDAELKILHKTLKKIAEDIERLNFNTAVSAFMICVNELGSLGCHKRKILEPLIIALAPFAPFITEELWKQLGNTGSVHQASFPAVEEKYLVESSFDYPVSVNGKVRAQVTLPLDISQEEAQKQVLELDRIKQFTNGNQPKKFIFVKGKIINVVV